MFVEDFTSSGFFFLLAIITVVVVGVVVVGVVVVRVVVVGGSNFEILIFESCDLLPL